MYTANFKLLTANGQELTCTMGSNAICKPKPISNIHDVPFLGDN